MDMKRFLYRKQCITGIYMTFGNLSRKLNATFGVAGAVISKPKGTVMSEVKTNILHDRFCAVNATKVPHFVDFLHYLHHNCIQGTL